MRYLPLVACVGVLVGSSHHDVAVAAPGSPLDGGRRSPPEHATEDARVSFGVAINSPLSWMTTGALGGSVYLGLGAHDAVRANIARYAYSEAAGVAVGDVFFDGDGTDATWSGSTFDLGLAYQYYPRRMFDGFSLEVGVLRRSIDHRTIDEFASPEDERITATGWGARAMVGWSWRFGDHAFVAAAVGLSAVTSRGTRVYSNVAYDPAYMTGPYEGGGVGAETYLRLGVALGAASGH